VIQLAPGDVSEVELLENGDWEAVKDDANDLSDDDDDLAHAISSMKNDSSKDLTTGLINNFVENWL